MKVKNGSRQEREVRTCHLQLKIRAYVRGDSTLKKASQDKNKNNKKITIETLKYVLTKRFSFNIQVQFSKEPNPPYIGKETQPIRGKYKKYWVNFVNPRVNSLKHNRHKV